MKRAVCVCRLPGYFMVQLRDRHVIFVATYGSLTNVGFGGFGAVDKLILYDSPAAFECLRPSRGVRITDILMSANPMYGAALTFSSLWLETTRAAQAPSPPLHYADVWSSSSSPVASDYFADDDEWMIVISDSEE